MHPFQSNFQSLKIEETEIGKEIVKRSFYDS